MLGFDVVSQMGDQALFLSAGGYHHHLGFNTWESKGGSPPPPGTTGLYHVAIRYPTREALADALGGSTRAKWPLDGVNDHGTHEALYLRDPDGNGLELAWDRDPSEWPLDAEGHLRFDRGADVNRMLPSCSSSPASSASKPPTAATVSPCRAWRSPDCSPRSLLAGCGGSGDEAARRPRRPRRLEHRRPIRSPTLHETVERERNPARPRSSRGPAVGPPGYDRVVFTFKNMVPGYKVAYVPRRSRRTAPAPRSPSTATPSLSVRMEPASGFDLNTGEGVHRLQGAEAHRRVEAGTKVITEVVRTGDFEAVLTWAAGLPEAAARSRSAPTLNPPRLVVDVGLP